MRIAFLLSSLHLSGGVRDVVNFANRLVARGHTCALVAPLGSVDPLIAEEIAPDVAVVESRAALPTTKTYSYQHVHLVWSLAQAAPAADFIISTHTPVVPAAQLAARILGKGRLVWLNQDYTSMFNGRPVEAWLFRHAQRWHELTVTISDDVTEQLRGFGPGRVETVGVGVSHPHLRRAMPIHTRVKEGPRTLLYVGDGRPRKGLQDFIAAAGLVYAQRQDIRLWIVCREACDFTTPVPHDLTINPDPETLARLYATCDMFVATTWMESLGLPSLEAMAAATPVVMTGTGGGLTYAQHEQNCLLVPVRQPSAVAAAILRLLDDPELAGQLSANGPLTAAQFDWEVVTDKLEQKLLHLLDRQAPDAA